MASSPEFVAFACEQLAGLGEITSRKMFGEYLIYVNAKPVLMICDDTAFVKRKECLIGLIDEASTGIPYEGAGLHYVLDLDNRELTRRVIMLLEQVTPVPKKRGKKS